MMFRKLVWGQEEVADQAVCPGRWTLGFSETRSRRGHEKRAWVLILIVGAPALLIPYNARIRRDLTKKGGERAWRNHCVGERADLDHNLADRPAVSCPSATAGCRPLTGGHSSHAGGYSGSHTGSHSTTPADPTLECRHTLSSLLGYPHRVPGVPTGRGPGRGPYTHMGSGPLAA